MLACGSNNRHTIATVSISAENKKPDLKEVKAGKEIEQKVQLTVKSEEKKESHEANIGRKM